MFIGWCLKVPYWVFLALVFGLLNSFFLLNCKEISLAACPSISLIWYHCVSDILSLNISSGRVGSLLSMQDLSVQYCLRYLERVTTVDCRMSSHLMINWKTTASGILGAIIGIKPLDHLSVVGTLYNNSV